MNKYTNKLILCLTQILGTLFLYATFSFIMDLELLKEVVIRQRWPQFIMVLPVIGISGFGIELGRRLLCKAPLVTKLFYSSICWAISMMILQTFLTVAPTSSCKCVTFRDSIMNVTDWRRVQLSLVLLMLCIILTVIFRYNANLQLTQSVKD